MFTAAFGELLFDVDFVPFPATWWGDGKVEEREARALQQLEALLRERPDQYAAVILEPLVQGAGGMRMCRTEFLGALEGLLRQYNVLVIYDEVMVGCGRTGEFFACLKAGTTPDMVCLAKGLTGGFTPLAATVCTERVYQAFYCDDPRQTFFHGHSYTANPLGCAAALASMDLLEKGGRFRQLETWHCQELEALEGNPRLGRLRVCGTIAAMDVAAPGREGYLHQVGPVLRQRFLEKGFLLRPLGNVVYLVPPYCIERDQLAAVYRCIRDVVDSL